jgi:hypothetical protein
MRDSPEGLCVWRCREGDASLSPYRQKDVKVEEVADCRLQFDSTRHKAGGVGVVKSEIVNLKSAILPSVKNPTTSRRFLVGRSAALFRFPIKQRKLERHSHC